MIGKQGFSLFPFLLEIIPVFANNNYTLTEAENKGCEKRVPKCVKKRPGPQG